MITSDEELSLAYLLDPTFELVNSNGKPLTNGYIEVYVHGTRTKYYCASDFNGTLHPFKIPLDSLGANVVLASPAHTYDVYVYNAFGNLVISRYNVTTVGFTTVINHETVVTSEDNTVEVNTSEASGKTYFDLSIADTVDSLNNELTQKIETASADLLDKIDQTKDELNQKIETASADLLDAIDRNKTEIMQNVESATAVLQYEIETVSSRQVQSDWAETDDELPSYIKNKPEEQELIGGDNIELVETATAVKINCTLDTTPFATHTEVDAKVNTATATLNNKIDQTKTEINSTINSVSSTINTRIDNVSSAFDAKLAEKKDKQSPYSATGSQTKTLTQIIQNEQGVVSAVFSDIDLPPQVPSVDIISPRNTILVSATTNPETNTKTFSLDVDDDHPQSNVQASTGWCNRVDESGNPLYATIYGDEYYMAGNKLWCKAGYHHVDQLVHISYSGEPVNRLQRLRIMSTYDRETEHYFDMSYPHEDLITISSVDYNAYAVPYYYAVLYYGAGTASAWPEGFVYKVDIDIHSLKAPLAKSESGQATYQAGRGIDPNALAVDVIQVDSSIPDQATVNATVATASSTLNTRINEVENEIPDVSNLATKNEVMSQVQAATAMIPDVSDFVTESEVASEIQSVTAMIPEAQVQSNWTETDTVDPSYIKNKPTETILVPGQNIAIEVEGATATISSDIDTSNLATKSEVMTQVQAATAMIPDVSDFATEAEVMSQVQAATAMIPEAQVQSNWTETNTADPSYIQNKPEEQELIAGDNIEFVESATAVKINCNVDTSNFATHTELQTTVQAATAMIPEAQVQSDWAETESTAVDFIKNKPTETVLIPGHNTTIDVQGASATINCGADETLLVAGNGINIDVQSGSATISCNVDTSNFATHTELQTTVQAATALIPDVSDLATKSEVMSQVQAATALIPDTSAIEADIEAISSTLTPLAEAINVDNFKVNASGQAFKITHETVTSEITQHVDTTGYNVVTGDPEDPDIDFMMLADISQFDLDRTYIIRTSSPGQIFITFYAGSSISPILSSSLGCVSNGQTSELTFTFNDLISKSDNRFQYDDGPGAGYQIKAVYLGSSTGTISDIYYTQTNEITEQWEYALKSDVNDKIQLVYELPANPKANVLYLIPEA